jgi:hypothetical protein
MRFISALDQHPEVLYTAQGTSLRSRFYESVTRCYAIRCKLLKELVALTGIERV